ncbi:hypothetical protein RND81_12G154000 [Saponaria officinalis]|uniref:Uncharacterized protein n=1 Tax=Saponaria officinalis TaxID=3572 RepID=A0AAW1HB29_SAPOF
MQNKKGNFKIKKGFLTVQVGLEEDKNNVNEPSNLQKYVIPIRYLYHPRFNRLLNRASEVYGYQVDGPLRLPCSIDDFLHINRLIEWDIGANQRRHHRILEF